MIFHTMENLGSGQFIPHEKLLLDKTLAIPSCFQMIPQMSTYPVSSEKAQQLAQRMAELNIQESDLEERFIRGGGPGGQKINKTSSTVVLLHRPSGIEIRCGQERSQSMNRFFARRELCERLAEKILGEKSKRQQEREKIRRQKRKRSKRQTAIMVDAKKRHGAMKSLRRRPAHED